MVEEKALKEEYLEKVTGGYDIKNLTQGIHIKVFFKDTPDGLIDSIIIDYAAPPEDVAKLWCQQNNKIYDSYQLDPGSTVSYNTQQLLNNVSLKVK